jgi:hypothetical protein
MIHHQRDFLKPGPDSHFDLQIRWWGSGRERHPYEQAILPGKDGFLDGILPNKRPDRFAKPVRSVLPPPTHNY